MIQNFALLQHIEFPDLRDKAFEIVSPPFVYQSDGDWLWKSNRTGYWNLWICLEGMATIRSGGIEYVVNPWTAFLFSGEAEVDGSSGTNTEHMRNFSIHFRLGKENDKLLENGLLGIQLQDTEVVNGLLNTAIRLAAYRDSFALHQLETLTMTIIGLMWRESVRPFQTDSGEIIYQQLDRIHSGQDMFRSVKELAAEAGLSRVHYGRCFLEMVGESPNRFIIAKRIERGCVLLRQTDWSIDRIARSIGYNDIYFFSRQFSKVMNCSPSEFRKKELKVASSRKYKFQS